MKRVLFVCTGNTCRSPMAEALLKKITKEKGIEVEARSAGLSAFNGDLASSQAIQVLSERGIHHSHRSQKVESRLIEWADLILTMTTNHKYYLINDYPESIDKVFTLKEFAHLDARTEQLIKELDQIYVEMELKRAEIESKFSAEKEEKPKTEKEKAKLQQEIDSIMQREQQILKELEGVLSDVDISDPFGGSVNDYRKCAVEIEESIRKIIDKWTEETGDQNKE